MSYIILKVTEAQLNATIDMVDTISAMIGCGSDFDPINNKNVKLFDRMLKKNGYSRNFK